MGIGLSLAKAIIGEDKGTITVDSNEKETKFTIKYYKI
jgi:nitrogen-specific signal transduction histidine kinase